MTKHAKPRLSVGMPVYNGEKYLAESIKGVLQQSFADFELVISDNCSTDGTEEICREFASSDRRIRYHRNTQNKGAAANYNLVFEISSAPFFRWQNCDDLIVKDYHELCYRTISERDDVALVYGQTELIDSEGRHLKAYDDQLNLQQDKPSERFAQYYEKVGLCNAIYGLMRRSAMIKGPLFGDGTFLAADLRFMAELTLQGKFVEIPRVCFYRRMHEDSSSWDSSNATGLKQFWSAGKGNFARQQLRLSQAYFRSFARLQLPLREKVALYRFWLFQMYANKRALAREILGTE